MPGWRPARVLARAAITIVSLALALIAVEAIVRLTAADPSMLMVKDAVLGQKYRPGMEAAPYDEEAGRHVAVRINSLGFRDREHSVAAAHGVRRVLMLGDSFTAGLSVDFDRTFPQRCERLLNASTSDEVATGAHVERWEVITLAVAGYGTAQELLAYEQYGRRFQPSVVVLNFFAGNDVSDNSSELSTSPRPYFTLVDGQLVEQPPSPTRQRLAGWLNEHSRLYAWQKRQMQKVERYVKRSVVVNPVHRVFEAEADERMQRAWALTEALILRLRDEVERDGATLLVSYIPFSDEVNPDWWEQTLRESPPLRDERWDFDGPSRRLGTFCRANRIAFQSAREDLAARSRVERDYFTHGHFNERGHEVYAAFLATQIRRMSVDR